MYIPRMTNPGDAPTPGGVFTALGDLPAAEGPPPDEKPAGGVVRALGDRFQEATATLLEAAGAAGDVETAKKYLRAAGHLVFAMAEIIDAE
jgi:hypothetical protein